MDAAAKTLRVRRGVVWPAAAHAAGDRVAAAVSHWPQSLIFDQSTYCPTATVDASVGPETWVEYNARVSAALVAGDVWDGLLIDRADGGESWLVGARGHARSTPTGPTVSSTTSMRPSTPPGTPGCGATKSSCVQPCRTSWSTSTGVTRTTIC